MKNFDYYAPRTIEQALGLLDKFKKEAKIYAGGTDLLIKIRDNVLSLKVLIDIKGIDDLRVIHFNPLQGLKVGAATTLAKIETSTLIKEKCTILSEVAQKIGSQQIRNKGTLGGNLCNGSPSADMAPPLIALRAQCFVISFKGERILPIEDLFIGPGVIDIKENEILKEIVIPVKTENSSINYVKLGQRMAMNIAVASVSTFLKMDVRTGYCEDLVIALGGVAPVPLRAKEAEKIIREKKITELLISETCKKAADECKPISDIRGSYTYRKDMVNLLTEQSLVENIEMLKKGK